MAYPGELMAEARQPNAERRYEIDPADLPVHCPLPEMSLWNSHPKVYLPLAELGEARCPYCGALYVLKETEPRA